MLTDSLEPLMVTNEGREELRAIGSERFEKASRAALAGMYGKKLGFGAVERALGYEGAAEMAEEAEEVQRLWERMERLMWRALGDKRRTEVEGEVNGFVYDGGVDWTILWRQLAVLPAVHLHLDPSIGRWGVAASDIAEAEGTVAAEGTTEDERRIEEERLFAPIRMAFYAPIAKRLKREWARWLHDWLEALGRSINEMADSERSGKTNATYADEDVDEDDGGAKDSADGEDEAGGESRTGADGVPSDGVSRTRSRSPAPSPPMLIGAAMKRVSPKYIPREWMLKLAYDSAYGKSGAAAQGGADDGAGAAEGANVDGTAEAAGAADGTAGNATAAEYRRHRHTAIRTLQRIFRRPYDEHSAEDEARFYRRAPAGSLEQGGIGFMS
jgi:hypothetical protein